MLKEILNEVRSARDAINFRGGHYMDRQEILDLIQGYDFYPDRADSYPTVVKAKEKNKAIISNLKKYNVKTFTVDKTEIKVKG